MGTGARAVWEQAARKGGVTVIAADLRWPSHLQSTALASSAIGWSRSWQVYRDPRWSHCCWYSIFIASSRARWVMGGSDTADVDSSF